MTLARQLSRAFHAIGADAVRESTLAHVRVLLIDAFACMLGGARAGAAEIARREACIDALKRGGASLLPDGKRVSPGAAALANGAMLRSLDLMDVYVDVDVSHPSEAIPAALACAEAGGATGAEFLDTVVAALAMHCRLAGRLALHRNGLHHVGNAAWVVPLAAGRLTQLGVELSAAALALSASGLLVPEGFSRGQVANVKALAYPLLARRSIELASMAADGLRAQPRACEEVLGLLERLFGARIDVEALASFADAVSIERITLKAYPAQYALQPLIAAGAGFRARGGRAESISHIVVSASRQTVSRTADEAKFRPVSAEAADHSLPFCVAAGLLDGGLAPEALERGRWRDRDVLALMDRIAVATMGEDEGFFVGEQAIDLTLANGSRERLDCAYPPTGVTWRAIATDKLETVAGERGLDAGRILAIIDGLDAEPSVAPLVAALCGREPERRAGRRQGSNRAGGSQHPTQEKGVTRWEDI